MNCRLCSRLASIACSRPVSVILAWFTQTNSLIQVYMLYWHRISITRLLHGWEGQSPHQSPPSYGIARLGESNVCQEHHGAGLLKPESTIQIDLGTWASPLRIYLHGSSSPSYGTSEYLQGLIYWLFFSFIYSSGTFFWLIWMCALANDIIRLSLASWSLFVSVPFENSPQLAAVASTFLSFIFAILAQAFGHASSGAAFIFTIIFPPGFYVFAIRAIAGFEAHQIPTNMLKKDPDNQLTLLSLVIAVLVRACLNAMLVFPLIDEIYLDRYFLMAIPGCRLGEKVV